MRSAQHIVSPAIWALVLALSSAAPVLAQGAPQGKVMMPWQKPQPKPHPPANFTEILPWLLQEGDKKEAPATWKVDIADPAEPVVPDVADFSAGENPLETGTIPATGLVLKTPRQLINAKSDGKAKAAAEAEQANGVPPPGSKIKGSIALPGDRPVGQTNASEVSSDEADVAQSAPNDEVPAVAPPMAQPVDAENATVPAPAEQHLNAGVPDAYGARPVDGVGADAVSATATPAAAHAVTGQHAAANTVAAPHAGFAQSGAPGTVVPPVAPAHTTTAQAVAPPPAESAPALPQAEEAPPIPDALPDATVTPVTKPVTSDLPSLRTRDLVEPVAKAATPTSPEATIIGEPQSKPRQPERLGDGANVAQQYCFNIADAAKDARYAWQKKTLAEIEAELKKRIALLDERTAEYQKWLARRDEFIRNAEENVVKIYAGMKVDAASLQLALMNEEAAAAVLAKLNTRNASAILNEMEPAKAAKLTMIMTGAAKLKRKKELQKTPATQGADASAPAAAPSAQAAGGRS